MEKKNLYITSIIKILLMVFLSFAILFIFSNQEKMIIASENGVNSSEVKEFSLNQQNNLDDISAEEEKQITVSEEGTYLEFMPKDDKIYKFSWEIVKEDTNSFIKSSDVLILEIFDESKSLINTNEGSLYDVYNNSYDSGETISIGQGVDKDDSNWFYKSIKQNCLKDTKYYIRLRIPPRDSLADELLEDGAALVKTDEKGNMVEDTETKTESTKEAKLIIAATDENVLEDKEGSSIWTRIFLILLIIVIVIIIFKNRKKNNKEISNNSNQKHIKSNESINNINSETDKEIREKEFPEFCSNCGNKLDAGDEFCGKCGAKVD